MIKKIIVFGLLLIITASCKKDFGPKDIRINTINFNHYGDCYPFVYNNSPYIVTDDSQVYMVDELNNRIDFVANLNVTYDPIGPMQEINGSLYFATERYIYKVNINDFSSISIVFVPSLYYGEIISFSVIDDIAFISFKSGHVLSNNNAFNYSSDLINVMAGARVIKTDGDYYMYSGYRIFRSSNGSIWNDLITSSDLVKLSGKNSGNSYSSKITGIIGDKEGKLLVSYIYNDSIYTDLLNKSFTTSVNLTKSGTRVELSVQPNKFVMGESFLLDGGVFFNFEYQLRSTKSVSYAYPDYSFYVNGSSTSASYNIKSNGVKGVVNNDLKGCIAPMKLNNKIYTYNRINGELVIVSE